MIIAYIFRKSKNQTDITTPDGIPLKLVDKFTYLGSSVSSTEKDIDARLTKAWTAIDRLSIIWKSDLTDKVKRSFFQAAVVSTVLYGVGVRFIAWRLRRTFLGECQRRPRHFWNCRTHLGYSPAHRPTLKRPCATLVRLVGRRTNTVIEYRHLV